MENREISMNDMELVNGGMGGSAKPLPYKDGFIVYQIQKGDKLGVIARRFNTTAEIIKSYNPTIKNVNDITAGYYIYIAM